MSVATDVEVDLDLSIYEPPKVLSELADVKSEVNSATIIAVIQSSLDNIRQQIILEKQQREALAEALAAQEAAAAAAEAEKGKGKAPETETGPANPEIVLPSLRTKPPRHSRFGLRRILHHLRDKSSDFGPESSAAGAARPRSEDSSSLTRLVYKSIKSSISAEDVVEQVECVSCLEDISPKDGIKTTCHYYCTECFQQLITISLQNEEQWPPKCCLNRIPERIIMKNVSKELFKEYKEKAEEFEIPIDKRLYCSEPDCGEWMRKVNRATKTARCTRGHVMCVTCRNAAHPQDEGCPEDYDRRMADQLAEEEGWRRCISCKILVEHREACQHMTCRCGAEFCYVCGARWRTCDCSMEQLQQRKNGAAARRAERQRREEAEEEWLQEALRAIEAEQRKQEEQEEIRRAEIARRREAKYAALRNTMLRLNDGQEVIMLKAHTSEAEEESKAAVDRRQGLVLKHKSKRQDLRLVAEAKIASAELEWQRELRERALWSRRLADDYCEVQTKFWAQFKGGQARLRVILLEYQRENFDRFQQWQQWQHNEMGHFRHMVKEEESIDGEFLDLSLRRFDDDVADQEAELKKRQAAERRWFQLVTTERIRLLSEIEMIEAETGGDEELDIGTAL